MATPSVQEYLIFSQLAYDLTGGESASVVAPSHWTTIDVWSDTDSGLNVVAFKNEITEQIVVAFRGTEPTSTSDLSIDAQIGAGVRPDAFKIAEEYVQGLREDNPDYSFFVTGHSLGGAIAQDVAATLYLRGASFGAPGVANLLSTGVIASAANFTNYIISTDPIGNSTLLSGEHVNESDNVTLSIEQYLADIALEHPATYVATSALASHALAAYGQALSDAGLIASNPLPSSLSTVNSQQVLAMYNQLTTAYGAISTDIAQQYAQLANYIGYQLANDVQVSASALSQTMTAIGDSLLALYQDIVDSGSASEDDLSELQADIVNTMQSLGYYIVQPGDTADSIALTLSHGGMYSNSIDAQTLMNINAAFGITTFDPGTILHVPVLYSWPTTLGQGMTPLSTLQNGQAYVLDGSTLYTVGASLDGHDSGALIIDTPSFAGTFQSFAQGTYAAAGHSYSTGLLGVTLTDPHTGVEVGTYNLNSTLTLYNGTVIDLPSTGGGMLTDFLTETAPPLDVLLSYLAQLGNPLTVEELEELDFDYQHPSGTPYTVAGEVGSVYIGHTYIQCVEYRSCFTYTPGAIIIGQDTMPGRDKYGREIQIPAVNVITAGLPNQFHDLTRATISNIQILFSDWTGCGVALTQSQFDSIGTIAIYLSGNGLEAAGGGTFSLASKSTNSYCNMWATALSGTTLIGNDQNGYNLYTSNFGNDTLIAGNGSGISLRNSGYGVNTLIGGTGGTEFWTGVNPTQGTVFQGNGENNVLNLHQYCDITGATISGIQTLRVGRNVTLTANQFNQFEAIETWSSGTIGAIYAANGGRYDLHSKNSNHRFDLYASSSQGTILIGNDADYETLTASATGTDTLIAGNGIGATLVAGQGVNTLIGGSGGDTFQAYSGLAAGSVVQGTGENNVLIAYGDISQATISGIQTLQLGDVTLTADQLNSFSSVVSAWGWRETITAATGGLYSLADKSIGFHGLTLIAGTNEGTTLIGNDGVYQTLQASNFGDDTLIAGNGGATLRAGNGNNTLTGGTGDDTLIGKIGDDLFTGGGGDDEMIGGEGTDIACYSGAKSEYTLTNTNGTWTITDSVAGRDGTDTFTGFEYLQFADQKYSLYSSIFDYFGRAAAVVISGATTAIDWTTERIKSALTAAYEDGTKYLAYITSPKWDISDTFTLGTTNIGPGGAVTAMVDLADIFDITDEGRGGYASNPFGQVTTWINAEGSLFSLGAGYSPIGIIKVDNFDTYLTDPTQSFDLTLRSVEFAGMTFSADGALTKVGVPTSIGINLLDFSVNVGRFEFDYTGLSRAWENIFDSENTNSLQDRMIQSFSTIASSLSWFTPVDGIAGTEDNDILHGTDGDNVLYGFEGDDTLYGGAGNDTYRYMRDEGTDTIIEAGSNSSGDIVEVWDNSSVLDLDDFNDLRFMRSGNDLIINLDIQSFLLHDYDSGQIVLKDQGSAESAVEWLRIYDDDQALVRGRIDLTSVWQVAGTCLATLNFSGSNSSGFVAEGATIQTPSADGSIRGGVGKDVLIGGMGNDRLDGGTGADTLLGGLGSDTYYVDNAGDVIQETTGWRGRSRERTESDTVLSSISWTLGDNLEQLTLTGTDAINGTGNRLSNTLVGNSADNTLNGGSGVDQMTGGLGNDTYIVDNLGDLTIETSTDPAETDTVLTSVNRTLGANLENLTLTGTRAINGAGNSLDNILTGNIAANKLRGAGGNDTLTGGGGQDMFYFDTALDESTNIDTITDFTVGEDLLRLDRSIFSSLTAGALEASQFCASTTGQASDGNDFLLYNTSNGDLLYDADGNGAAAAIRFATLSTSPAITAASCLVVG